MSGTQNVGLDAAKVRAKVPAVEAAAAEIPALSVITTFSGACAPHPTMCTAFTCYGGCEHPSTIFASTLAGKVRELGNDAQALRARVERLAADARGAIGDLARFEEAAEDAVRATTRALDDAAASSSAAQTSASAYAAAVASRRAGGTA